MRITIPKNEELCRGLKEVLYKVVKEGKNTMTYEGIFSVKIDMADLGMKTREFMHFCASVHVKDGYKVRKGTRLYIKPYKRRRFRVTLSKEERQLLEDCAREMKLPLSTCARQILLSALAKRAGM